MKKRTSPIAECGDARGSSERSVVQWRHLCIAATVYGRLGISRSPISIRGMRVGNADCSQRANELRALEDLASRRTGGLPSQANVLLLCTRPSFMLAAFQVGSCCYHCV